MEMKNQTVLVCGAGISGISAARLLLLAGAQVIIYDGNRQLNAKDILCCLHADEAADVTVVLGEAPIDMADRLSLAVLSPGVPVDAPFVVDLRSRGVPITGEIELASRFDRGCCIAITGTNGKTTTTTLVGELIKARTDQTFVVGNIGNPYTGCVRESSDHSVTVAEISSFQLETVQKFHPHISAVLNVTPDHLNRHHTMQCYIDTKKRIFENQTAADYTILNFDDPVTAAMAEETSGQVVFFSSSRVLSDGYYLQNGKIMYAHDGETELLCAASDLQILGRHNMENVMAAAAIAHCMQVPTDVIRRVLCAFEGVEHRIEFVAEKKGVTYYNDSKGTNPDAAIKAVEAMVRPTILIGGGYDKQSSYDAWIESFGTKIRQLILLGETADQIERCARAHGFTQIVRVESLQEAVCAAAAYARPQDAVLLSPACASWDMFPNYEVRGKLFKQYVQELPQE